MKKRFSILLLTVLLLTVPLTSCSQPAYTPDGEVYVKTPHSMGDSVVSEVVDITVEKAVYAAEGDLTVPVKIGVGHQHWPLREQDGPAYGWLEVKFWHDVMPKEEPTDTLRIDYPDWETAKFDSTEPEERLRYFSYYGEFYPLYHETVEWTIPADVTYGCLEACVYEVDENENQYSTQTVRIWFERIDGELVFSTQ